MKRATGKAKAAYACLVTLAIMSASVLIAENHLRHTRKFANYAERQGLAFDPANTTERLHEPWLWVYEKNAHFAVKKPEFTQMHSTNSLGLAGVLPPLKKEKNEFRIIAVGDSFTEGIGDPEGLGYVGRLESDLSKEKTRTKYRMMNAGIAGSDPVFGLELIKRRLLRYNPDLALLTINDTDIGDLKRRGGLDRYDRDGWLKIHTPAWEWLFNRSHLFRAFMLGWLGYSWELLSPEENAEKNRMAIHDLIQSCIEASRLASENGFKLLVIVHPHWFEVQRGKMDPGLLEVEEGLKKNGVDFADLLPDFISEIPKPISPEYYWPLDSHFTPKGYQVFARAVEIELEKRHYIREKSFR